MSDRITWLELLEVDEARAYRLRLEEADDDESIESLHKEIGEQADRIQELEWEVRDRVAEGYALEAEVKRLRVLCAKHGIDSKRPKKSQPVPMVQRIS